MKTEWIDGAEYQPVWCETWRYNVCKSCAFDLDDTCTIARDGEVVSNRCSARTRPDNKDVYFIKVGE